MKGHQPKLRASTIVRALGIGVWIAASGAMAQELAPSSSQDQTGKSAESMPVTTTNQTPVRTMATGSNIIRARSDRSLPLLVLDRAYIEQSGTTTPTELIQSLPQAQNLRSR